MGAPRAGRRPSIRALAGRTATATVVALRLGWLVLALVHFGGVDLELPLYGSELVLLVVLVAETQPRVTGGIDPGPAGGTSRFASDVGLRATFVATAFAFLAILIGLLDVHVPHALAVPLEAVLPATDLGLIVTAGGVLLGGGWVIGWYAHLRDPGPDGVLYRTLRTLIGFADARTRTRWLDQVEDALAGEVSAPVRAANLAITALVVGTVVALLAMMVALLCVPVLMFPRFFLLVVIAWLGYDVYRHRGAGTEPAVRRSLADLSHEVDAPKLWLFDLSVLEAGLKGVLTTVVHVLNGVLALFLLAGAGIAILAITGGAIIEVGRALAAAVTEDGVGVLLGDPILVPTAIGVVLFALASTAATLALGAYAMAVWYQLLQRLPAWLETYWAGGLDPVESRPLPTGATGRLAALGLAYFAIVGGIAAITGRWGEPSDRLALLVVWVVGLAFAVHARYGVRWVRDAASTLQRGTVTISRRQLRWDNHRIVVFLLVVFGGPVAFLSALDRVSVASLLAGLVAFYYAPELDRAAGQTIEGRVTHALVTQAGLVLVIGLILFPVVSLYPSLAPLRWFIPLAAAAMLAGTVLDYLVYWR